MNLSYIVCEHSLKRISLQKMFIDGIVRLLRVTAMLRTMKAHISQKCGSTIRQARYTISCKHAHKSHISCYLHSVELSSVVSNLVHARGAHYMQHVSSS